MKNNLNDLISFGKFIASLSISENQVDEGLVQVWMENTKRGNDYVPPVGNSNEPPYSFETFINTFYK